jgi:hypothetical protein
MYLATTLFSFQGQSQVYLCSPILEELIPFLGCLLPFEFPSLASIEFIHFPGVRGLIEAQVVFGHHGVSPHTPGLAHCLTLSLPDSQV